MNTNYIANGLRDFFQLLSGRKKFLQDNFLKLFQNHAVSLFKIQDSRFNI